MILNNPSDEIKKLMKFALDDRFQLIHVGAAAYHIMYFTIGFHGKEYSFGIEPFPGEMNSALILTSKYRIINSICIDNKQNECDYVPVSSVDDIIETLEHLFKLK